MKVILISFALLFSFYAQAQYGTELVVDTTIYGSYVSDIHIKDMNNDGFQDLVISNKGGNGRVTIYYNDSFGAFGKEIIISTNKKQINAIGIGDFDNKGLKDVIAITKLGKITRYLQTTLGKFTEAEIFSGIFFPLDVITTDLNKDGYMDFVTLGDLSILAFTNDSTGNFDTMDVASFTEYYSFCVGDLNADGYPDLLAGSGSFFTFINDGKGVLVRDSINKSLRTPPQIHECELADMDGDKDLDVVVYYTNAYDKVDWYSNNGSGKLTKETTITSSANNLFDINIGDIDLDKKPDLCFSYDQEEELVWIKNKGNGIFSAEKSINPKAIYATLGELGDFDNDGDLDLCHNGKDGLYYYINSSAVLSIEESNEINVSWYPNPSNGSLFIESSTNIEIRIYNMQGTMVYGKDLLKGTQQIEHDLPKGNYIVEILNSRRSKRDKLIILH